MSSRFVSLAADDVKVSDVLLTDEKGKVLGSIYVENNKFIFNPPLSNLTPGLIGATGPTGPAGVDGIAGPTGPAGIDGAIGPTGFIEEIIYEQRSGLTGPLDGTTISTQSTNVMSYNNSDKKVTYRELGLYNELLPSLPKTGSEDDVRIVSKHSIIPETGATLENTGYNLGNSQAYWNSVYAKDIHTMNGAMYIKDPVSNEAMTIQYNPVTLQATISNKQSMVQTVNTSLYIPNQIDANLIPFTGFTYVGRFNPDTYIRNINAFFDMQTLHLIYNIKYNIITSPISFEIPPITRTNAVFQTLAGIYYVVSDLGPGITRDITFNKMSARTSLYTYDKSSEGLILSTLVSSNPKKITLADNDIIVLSVGIEPNNVGTADIVFEWTLMQFRVPINGVTSANIVDGAITNNKLALNSVSYLNLQYNSVGSVHLQNLSVINDKIAENAVTLTKLSPEVQELLYKGSSGNATETSVQTVLASLNSLNNIVNGLQNTIKNDFYKMERRMLAMEEFVNTMLYTYEINNPLGTRYSYTAALQNYVNNYSVEFYSKNSSSINIKLNEYTYNIFTGAIDIVSVTGMIKYTLKQGNFGNVLRIGSFPISNISESDYPITAVLKDSYGAGLMTVYLSYVGYSELQTIV